MNTTDTTTLAEKDARIAELTGRTAELNHRIAELEAALNARPMPGTDAFNVMARMDARDDDRRRFVDERAMRLYLKQHLCPKPKWQENAAWAYDAAEALAAERDRRMQG